MAELSFVMWNCSGVLRTASPEDKLHFLINNFSKFDVLVLLETHHGGSGGLPPILNAYKNSYHFVHTGASSGDPYAGIIVLVDKRIELLGQTELIAGRLLNIKLGFGGGVFCVSAMYGYSGKRSTPSKLKLFTEHLEKIHTIDGQNMILGDFNFVHDDLDRTSRAGRGLNQLDKSLVGTWVDFIDGLGLVDPFRARNPKRRMYSYVHTQYGAKSRIDRVYLGDEMSGDVCRYRHTPTPFNKTHRIVSFSVCQGGDRGPGYWKMNTNIIMDLAYSKIVEKTVGDVVGLRVVDPIERWLIFVETIRIETRAYCTRRMHWERAIKSICEARISELEGDAMLDRDGVLQREYEYYTLLLNDWNRKKIEGNKARVRTGPRFEFNESNIDFLAGLEKRSGKKRCISRLSDQHGQLKHETDDLKQIATDYYTDLFTEKETVDAKTSRLFGNISRRISQAQRRDLDRDITLEELEKAVMKLQKGKSPGPDGIPAEFYQAFWQHLRHLYLDFINSVKFAAFPRSKNTSITVLVYKNKGEVTLLKNYRPIALLNTDVKILTKLLAMRLNLVLPSIIHESQTSVFGRRIGDNINLVRDLVDLVNRDDEAAAFLFVDQEKAFDRVNHTGFCRGLGSVNPLSIGLGPYI